jgi:predicted acetyltransferase
MREGLSLLRPGESHREQALEFIAEFRAQGSTPNGSAGLDNYLEDYPGWLEKLAREGDEAALPPGKVGADTYFAVRNEDSLIAGMISIRRKLNDYLYRRGGHIGYCVRPSERRKGCATEMLRLGLLRCRELGLDRALITCDKTNIPSARVIRRNGGVLEDEIFNEDTSAWVQRYWVPVKTAPPPPIRAHSALRAEPGFPLQVLGPLSGPSGLSAAIPCAEEPAIAQRIAARRESSGLLAALEERFSLSELSTLLLEVFRAKARDTSPPELLRRYRENRFVRPSALDPAAYHRLSLELLERAKARGYTPLELSPVTALGASSVIAPVDQNKVLSALRGAEVLSDAANALALEACALKKGAEPERGARFRYCAIHRHIRAQRFPGKGLPHFALYAMIISGTDGGNRSFEKEALLETLMFYRDFLSGPGNLGAGEAPGKIRFVLWPRGGEGEGFAADIAAYLRGNGFPELREEEPPRESGYYRGLQFKIRAARGEEEYEIGDGGFVDWPQKLLQNRKERMLVSGMGLERLLNNTEI